MLYLYFHEVDVHWSIGNVGSCKRVIGLDEQHNWRRDFFSRWSYYSECLGMELLVLKSRLSCCGLQLMEIISFLPGQCKGFESILPRKCRSIIRSVAPDRLPSWRVSCTLTSPQFHQEQLLPARNLWTLIIFEPALP